jgi:8-oxo-dGTP diphosphatase
VPIVRWQLAPPVRQWVRLLFELQALTPKRFDHMKLFDKVGLAVVRDNKLLLCRPYGFDDLIMPGGIRKDAESDTDCLIREITEELGDEAELEVSNLRHFGVFEDAAAGHHDAMVRITLYIGDVRGDLRPSSEIKELVWFGPSDDPGLLSQIVRNHIIPALRDAKIM